MGSQRVRHSIRQILKCWDFLRYHRSSVFPSKEMRTSSSIFRHKKKNFIILFMSTCHKTIAQHLYTYMIMIINFIRNTIPFNHFKALCMHVCVLSRFSRVQLFVTLWTVACQAPLSIGILQARTLEWVAHGLFQGISSTQGLNPLMSPTMACRFFTTSATWEAQRLLCEISIGQSRSFQFHFFS